MTLIFKIIGAIGLILVCIGIANKKRKIQDIFYISGGLLLEIYSIYLGDIIFIILQAVFTFVTIMDFILHRHKKS